MEIKKIENCNYVMFPRLQRPGLKPQHVERDLFKAELKHVEGHGDYWLLHQQAKPHLVAHVQFATDEADFDKKLGTAIALQQLHEYIEGDLTFFCMLAGINADEVPPTWPDRIRVPVRALSAATRWWYEYGEEALTLK